MKKLQTNFLLIAVALASCKAPKPLVYKGVNHFGVEQAGFKNTVVSLNLNLYNPNRYSLKLKHTQVDVYINNHHAGLAMINDKYIIPRLDTFSLPVLLKVDLMQVIPNALQLLINKEIALKLNGEIKAGRHGIYIKIPVSYEGTQKIK